MCCYSYMPDEEKPDKDSTSCPDHKIARWPEYIQVLMLEQWIGGFAPSKIANNINQMGVLADKVHHNSVSQFINRKLKADPSLKDKRKQTKCELVEQAKLQASGLKEHIVGKIKEATLQIRDEVTDELPRGIRTLLDLLRDEDDPKQIKMLTDSLQKQVILLERISGVDVARQIFIHEKKREIDLNFQKELRVSEDLTPKDANIVEIAGWEASS